VWFLEHVGGWEVPVEHGVRGAVSLAACAGTQCSPQHSDAVWGHPSWRHESEFPVCTNPARYALELEAQPIRNGKGKVILYYSLPSVGPRADPSVQAVSPQVNFQSPPPLGGRLPLLSARPAVTFPAEEHHCLSTSTKLYCLVTEAHRCEQLAQGYYTVLSLLRIKPST